MPSQPIMGAAVQSLTEEQKKQQLIQDAVNLIKIDTSEQNSDSLLTTLKQNIEYVVNSSGSQLSPSEILQQVMKTINTLNVNNQHNPKDAVVFSSNTDGTYNVVTLGTVLHNLHGIDILDDPQYLQMSEYGVVNGNTQYIETIVTKDGSLYRCRINAQNKQQVNYKPLDVQPEQRNNPPVPPVNVIQLTPENINQISDLLKTLQNILNAEYEGYEKADSILKIDDNILLMDIQSFLSNNQGEDSYNQFIEQFNNLDDSLKNQKECYEQIGAAIIRLRNLLPK